jgi:hypothetical protein
MFLYIFNDVLCDYTPGMAIIASENLDEAKAIFIREFDREEYEIDRVIRQGKYKVLRLDENVHRESGLIDVVWGGG